VSDAELEGLDADDAGHLLLLVWNTAGGGSEVTLLDTPDRHARTAPDLDGRGVRRPAQPDGSTAVLAVESPLRPASCEPGHRDPDLDPSHRGPDLPTGWSSRPCSSSAGGTGCR
jgi:hypothetical protein